MGKIKKKNKKSFVQIITVIITLMLMAGGGFFGGYLIANVTYASKNDLDIWTIIIGFIFTIASIFLVIYLQVIIHELGHLIFGLRTRFKFVSFRIGNFLWKREKGKIKVRRSKAAKGIAGQCLMKPATLDEEDPPYILYNLGGGILNLFSSLLGGIVLFTLVRFFDNLPQIISSLLAIFIVFGLLIGLSNLIPLTIGIPNDGKNLLSIRRDRRILDSLYKQLLINADLSQGKEIKDLDQDMVGLHKNADIGNHMNTYMVFIQYYKHLAKQEFDKAEEKLEFITKYEDDIIEIYKNSLYFEKIFMELLGECNKELIDEMLTKNMKKQLKKSKNDLSSQRVYMAYEALYNNDIDKALNIHNNIKKLSKKDPLPGIVAMELEMGQEVIKIYNDRSVV